jgi:hypothetical protein
MMVTVLPTIAYPLWASLLSLRMKEDMLVWCFFWIVVAFIVSLEESLGSLLRVSNMY